MVSTLPVTPPERAARDARREQLTNLRSLLVLSILMTESADEEQILRLAASCARSLGPWSVAGFGFVDGSWRSAPECRVVSPTAALGRELAGLPAVGGPLASLPDVWAWAFPLRSVSGLLGHLVACADEVPDAEGQFLAQVLAQQTGVAVSNARLHQSERASAQALGEANTRLEQTVAALRRGMRIHERLTEVAASGEGSTGIADALHSLTGYPVAIEDRYGNLRAWAGPSRPDPYPKPAQGRRDALLRRLRLEGHPVREGERVHALASPRPDLLGVIALIDPQGRVDEPDVMALEHGATVLAVELARLRGLADAELRLRRDLLHDLLAGTDDEGALFRAGALGYDLGHPHRVVLLTRPGGAETHDDTFLHAVRRAVRETRLTALLGTVSGTVVALVPGTADWEALRQVVLREQGGGRCRMGVGELYDRPHDLPRSYREARLALGLRPDTTPDEDRASVYAELGVFRMFAALPDLGDVEDFAQRWLRPLIDYDAAKHTDLLRTLTTYLDRGGRYEATATTLCIHRSTLKYRLQRIRELTGYDLTDPETQFNLQLATRAWTTLGALWTATVPTLAEAGVAGRPAARPAGNPGRRRSPHQDEATGRGG